MAPDCSISPSQSTKAYRRAAEFSRCPHSVTQRGSILRLSRAERWWPGLMVARSVRCRAPAPGPGRWYDPAKRALCLAACFTDQRMPDLIEHSRRNHVHETGHRNCAPLSGLNRVGTEHGRPDPPPSVLFISWSWPVQGHAKGSPAVASQGAGHVRR